MQLIFTFFFYFQSRINFHNLIQELKMDQLDLVSQIYSCKSRIKNLVNNELLSDICFQVGDDKIKIYGHQLILSLGKYYLVDNL